MTRLWEHADLCTQKMDGIFAPKTIICLIQEKRVKNYAVSYEEIFWVYGQGRDERQIFINYNL